MAWIPSCCGCGIGHSSCSSNWTPSMETSICCGCSPRKKKREKKKKKVLALDPIKSQLCQFTPALAAYERTHFYISLQALVSINCISLIIVNLNIFFCLLAICLSSENSLFIFLAHFSVWMFELFLLVGTLRILSTDFS